MGFKTGNAGDVTIIAGDVVGPASSTDGGFAKFDGTTGKLLKDSPATIAYSFLVLTGSIVNADIAAAAGIAYSKLNLTGAIVNADIAASAGIDFSKLAALASGNILVGSAGNVATSVAVTGDVLISNTGVTTYNGIVPLAKGGTNKNMTAVNGGVVYTDADSMEVTAAGNNNEYLASTGAGSPIWQRQIPPFYRTYTSGTAASHDQAYAFVISTASATVGATYTNNGNTYTVLATIASARLVYMSGTADPTTSGTLTKASGTGDATITFVYYREPNYARVRGVGGGGGSSGGGSATTSGINGGDGTATTFGTSLLSANPGLGGVWNGAGGDGGTSSISSPALGLNMTGGKGDGTKATTSGTATLNGAFGGSSGWFPATPGTTYNSNGAAGASGSGCGASGGGNNNTVSVNIGAGGGGGGFFDAIIPGPLNATYTYTVGTGGTAGNAGTGGNAGAAGGSGRIEVIEFF